MDEVSSSYWRVTFANGPVNLIDPDTLEVAVSGIKQLVDVASLPSEAELAAGFRAYFATSGRPVNAPFVQTLFELGLQQPDGIERELGVAIGRLRQEPHRASRPA